MPYQVPYLQIEPTTKCNFTCGFCVGRTMEQGMISVDSFASVIDHIAELKHIQLQGEGEPFSHPDLFSMIDMIGSRHPAAKISITTNGTYLTPSTIEKIMNCPNIYSILVSIESPSPDKFRDIRGGDLTKIIRNMRNLMSEKRKRGISHPVLGFAVTILNSTFCEFSDIVELYNELGLDGEFTIQYLQNMKTYTDAYNERMQTEIPSLEQIKAFQREIDMEPELRKFLIEQKVPGFFDELYSPDCEAACTWLKQGLYVNHKGYATGCSYIKKSGYAFGNVEDMPMERILEKRDKALEELTNHRVPEPCHNCPDLTLA